MQKTGGADRRLHPTNHVVVQRAAKRQVSHGATRVRGYAAECEMKFSLAARAAQQVPEPLARVLERRREGEAIAADDGLVASRCVERHDRDAATDVDRKSRMGARAQSLLCSVKRDGRQGERFGPRIFEQLRVEIGSRGRCKMHPIAATATHGDSARRQTAMGSRFDDLADGGTQRSTIGFDVELQDVVGRGGVNKHSTSLTVELEVRDTRASRHQVRAHHVDERERKLQGARLSHPMTA